MKASFIVTLILTVYILLAIFSGYNRGLLSRGRWVLGIIFGILAVPVISPLIKAILKKTGMSDLILTDIPIFQSFTGMVLNLFIFTLSLFIVKYVVYILTDVDLPPGFNIINKVTGAMFGIIECCMLVWIFEALLSINSQASGFNSIHTACMGSWLYSLIANHNVLANILQL